MADQEARIDLGIDGLGPAEHIGRGGFADVYRAEQLSLRRTVAVKVLRAQASDADAEAKFERECHAIGAVSDHPHIVGVHEGGFTRNGRAYLVMEYLPGGSLLDRLADHGPMEVSDIVDTSMKIAKALAVAHQAGVLHRDVKPANIMISAYGEPALGDFGIARIEGGHQTATGLVTASFAHAAPEVLEGMAPSANADIYSLGSTMFELMTGHAPYYSPSDESIWPLMKRILSEPMPSPESVGMSPQLGTVFLRATARNPNERYLDADEMADDLATLVADPLALARYPAIGGPAGGSRVGDQTRPAGGAPSGRPADSSSGRRPASGLPSGPPPAPKPDLMSLRGPETDVLPAAAAPGTGRFSDLYGPDAGRVGGPGGDGPHSTPRGRGGRTWMVVAAAALVGAVGGGALLLRDRADTGVPQTEATSTVTVGLAAAATGPVQAGEAYELELGPLPDGAQVRLLVDGEPTGAPGADLPSFTPSVGRHSVAVEISTPSGVEVTEAVELYARGGPPTAGYTASLGRVDATGDGWSSALAIFDRLAEAGHVGLEMVSTDQLGNLTEGQWAVYVGGFDEDADGAEEYCRSFDLPIPTHCHPSYFRPMG